MPYPSVQAPANERAAAAVYGAVAGLFLAGQDDAAHYVLHQLEEELLWQLHELVDHDVETALAAALRRRFDSDEDLTVATAPALQAVESQRPTPEQQVRDALQEVLPLVDLARFTGSEAFGRLVYEVFEAAERDRVEPVEVVRRLRGNVVTLVEDAEDPAMLLAAAVHSWTPVEGQDRL